jgi:uncharacterized protein YvpB
MALFYWNLDPSEEELQARLGSNSDPDLGFRGVYSASPNGLENYRAHAPALKQLVESYPTTGKFRGDQLSNLNDVKQALASNEPVLLWVTFGLTPSHKVPMTFQGQEVDLVPNEHVVTAYGYDPTGFFIYDPESINNVSGHVDTAVLAARTSLFQHPALAIHPLF